LKGSGRAPARRFVLCADDFGMTPGANEAILGLATRGRVTALSCLVGAPAWREGAAALLRTSLAADVGLHLTFGDESPSAVVWRAARGRLGLVDPARLEGRVAAQLDAFADAMGRAPAFVDGHLHVHQVPGVREALLRVLARRFGDRPPWVRSTVPLRERGAKAAVIAALGGLGLRAALRARGIRHNVDFAGVYDFSPRADYASLMRGWLADVADGGLVLCHPVSPSPGPETPDAVARRAEGRYLLSDAFASDCVAAGAEPALPAEVIRSPSHSREVA
jgi:hypothetical protein